MTTTDNSRQPANQKWFRQVLGQYPTGVCVVTGPKGDLALALTVYEFAKPFTDTGIHQDIERAVAAARRVTGLLGGVAAST